LFFFFKKKKMHYSQSGLSKIVNSNWEWKPLCMSSPLIEFSVVCRTQISIDTPFQYSWSFVAFYRTMVPQH
jgi:hypothetical protein